MAEPRGDKNDLVLASNEFAHIQDTSKGEIDTYVGPFKVPPSGDNLPLMFDFKSKRFREVRMEDCKQGFVTAPAGWYVILLNPAARHPKVGGKNSAPDDMAVGNKIVIQGPCSFPLWPGQMAEVVQGHRLRSNEYLVIEVYDDEAARKSWTEATVKGAGQTGVEEAKEEAGDGEKKKKPSPKDEKTSSGLLGSVPADLANGKRYVIKGTEVAFYIPPSGIKVVKEGGSYIRQAVTLEKLEYAILLDEDGDKEFAYGPKVVFPQPTQAFIITNGKNKYKAIELDSLKGVYIKVIESYKDDDADGTEHKEGEELFITGDGIIHFPRKEHSIIKYGEQEIHYATAIPKGEGRYVLDRKTGEVKTVVGPKMYLPDPRNEVITRRILTEREVKLFYPGNQEALAVNRMLAANNKDSSPEALAAYMEKTSDRMSSDDVLRSIVDTAPGKRVRRGAEESEERFGGDAFDRKTGYTQPRTVVLDTKYLGAVPINIWTGYAVKVVNKTGAGHVVVGPDAILLEYDETLEPMQLSTGTPKSADKLLDTAYLKVHGNKVSDQVRAITADLVEVEVMLSYRVNFEGNDPLMWFSVENYVKFLCDHISSVLKSVIKKYKISDLHANSTEIIRDSILGRKPEAGDRLGMVFKENNMQVYDVEVFDLVIGDKDVQRLLIDAQQMAIKTTLQLYRREQEVNATRALEKFAQEELDAKRSTEAATHKAELARISERSGQSEAQQEIIREAEKKLLGHQHQMDMVRFEQEEVIKRDRVLNEETLKSEKIREEQSRTEIQKAIEEMQRLIRVANWKAEQEHEEAITKLLLEANKDHAEAAKIIADAFSPQLVEAINTLRDANLLGNLADRFGDLSVLEGKGLLATASRFLDVIPQGLAPLLTSLLPKGADVTEKAKEVTEG